MSRPESEQRPLALIVDDNAALRMLAVKALTDAGFDTCEAADGEQALQLFDLQQPDILLLDLEMPVMDGYTVCQRIRASAHGCHTPVLVMTGHEDNQSIDRAYHAGATDFITKPVNWKLLGHKTHYLLRGGRLLQHAEEQRVLLAQAERMARIGSWKWHCNSKELNCSPGIRTLFALEADQELTPESWLQFIVSEERDEMRSFFDKLPQQHTLKAFEHTQHINNTHGEKLTLQVRGTLRFDATGQAVSVEGTMQDMTECIRLEAEKQSIRDQLEHSQHMESLGIMTGGIAHDFNNMLAAIVSNLYLAQLMAKGNIDLERKLTSINNICMRAAAIIKSMLTFARNDYVRKTNGELNTIVQSTCRILQSNMPVDIKFDLQIDPHPMHCLMNVTQIQQVLMNLVNNARLAVADVSKPRIEVTAAPYTPSDADSPRACKLSSNKWLRIQIRDNGSGISNSHMGKIFEPFFTTRGVGEGTGLGLSVAHGAIESHGGFIDVQSSTGKGTTFSIFLPMTSMESIAPAASTSSDHTGSGETILLVDDNDELHLSTARVLNKLGYKTIDASNGKEAIHTYSQHTDKIDLILMDVVMPVLGGIESAKEIRRKNREVPIVFITGYDLNSSMVSGIGIENTEVLSKPFSMAKLGQLIGDRIKHAAD
ncbi:MAG: hypothetical protein CO188_00920 [Zetaproteobacteria bacterium CG_4_9_14_3_um_filter_54_145]|nr:MAG: hypothetical protein COZ50_13390 [Zetaproteobacteria bacterium CG_4_10_14_3_um_filter_54_28]PJA30998.1 MAG: hypothetical protein CO188_00920 [Zetaproteobacteria bacterium CG_4_9_14_3_um_filter_54_145]